MPCDLIVAIGAKFIGISQLRGTLIVPHSTRVTPHQVTVRIRHGFCAILVGLREQWRLFTSIYCEFLALISSLESQRTRDVSYQLFKACDSTIYKLRSYLTVNRTSLHLKDLQKLILFREIIVA